MPILGKSHLFLDIGALGQSSLHYLVLPDGVSNTSKVLKMLSLKIGKDIYLSLMAQYIPAHKAYQYPEINRKIGAKEYKEALKIMEEVGA